MIWSPDKNMRILGQFQITRPDLFFSASPPHTAMSKMVINDTPFDRDLLIETPLIAGKSIGQRALRIFRPHLGRAVPITANNALPDHSQGTGYLFRICLQLLISSVRGFLLSGVFQFWAKKDSASGLERGVVTLFLPQRFGIIDARPCQCRAQPGMDNEEINKTLPNPNFFTPICGFGGKTYFYKFHIYGRGKFRD